jgi:hypothetical protein
VSKKQQIISHHSLKKNEQERKKQGQHAVEKFFIRLSCLKSI